MILMIALTALWSYSSLAAEPYEMVIVSWTGAKHVPFSVQTLPYHTLEICEGARKRIEHNLEIKNEELERVGRPRMGYTLMCRPAV
jgi:hypothetical protein